jgi:hypothetical protein
MSDNNVNSKYKDTLFRVIFGENNEYALALYNAVNGTDYTDSENLQIVTLEDAMYIGRKNDAAYIFHDVLSMFEQQSTFNPNMPLRGLGYVSDSFKEYIAKAFPDSKKLYSATLIHIPTPKFYVLYNGIREQPEEITLRLSDAYEGEGDVEVIAHMLNINKGHNEMLLNACKPLRDYSELVDRVRRNKKKGLNDEKAVAEAVDSCIGDGILADILRKERARIMNILIEGISEEEYRKVQEEDFENKLREETAAAEARGEARGEKRGEARGEKRGEAKGEKNAKKRVARIMLTEGESVSRIKQYTTLSETEILSVAAEMGLNT